MVMISIVYLKIVWFILYFIWKKQTFCLYIINKVNNYLFSSLFI